MKEELSKLDLELACDLNEKEIEELQDKLSN